MIVNTNQIPPLYISHCSAEFLASPVLTQIYVGDRESIFRMHPDS